MTLKTKLISIIVAFVMVVSLMLVGIFASSTITMQMGGNVTFNATDLQVTISDGVLANGTMTDSTSKMQGVKIDAYDDGAEELATWQGLNLTFNESGEDMTITFTITNNSTTDNTTATVSVDQGTANNATISVTTPSSPATIQANNGSQQFAITFHVTDRNSPASITGFQIDIDLEKESTSGSTEGGYTITFNDSENGMNSADIFYIKSDSSDTIYNISYGKTVEVPVNSLLMISDYQSYLSSGLSVNYANNDIELEPYAVGGGGHTTNFKIYSTIIGSFRRGENTGIVGENLTTFTAVENDIVNTYTSEDQNILYIEVTSDIEITFSQSY